MEATLKNYKGKVFIYYSHNRVVFRESTKINWADKSKNDNSQVIASKLKRVQDIITEYKMIHPDDPSVDYLKAQLKKPELIKSQLILDLFDRVLEIKRKSLSDGSLKDWNNLRTAIVRYEKLYGAIYVKNIDDKFYHEFQVFLSQKYTVETKRGKLLNRGGLNANTIRKRIAVFNAMLKMSKIEIPKFDLVDGYEADFVYLKKEELREFINLKHTGLKQDVQKIFIILCLTGMRYSDYEDLLPEHIVNNAIDKKAIKTKERFVVPIHQIVRKIFSEYHFDEDHKFQGKLPQCELHTFNVIIKKIISELPSFQNEITKNFESYNKNVPSKRVKKYDMVGSHTGRHTFVYMHITNENDGKHEPTPIVPLSEMTGHKTMKILMGYYKRFEKPNYHYVDNIRV